MSTFKAFKIGILSPTALPDEDIQTYLENQKDVYGQICFLLLEVLHASYQISFADSGGILLENGTWTGLIGMLNRSEIDLAMTNFFVSEDRNEAVHFLYPFNLDEVTFITRKPEYSPQTFAIFATVSLSVWVALAISMTVIIIFNFFLTKKKCSLDAIVFNILAVFLSQHVSIKMTTMSEKLLHCSWMMGAIFFTFCYNSVLLSFLTFPPKVGVTNFNELARAVQQSGYNCMFGEGSSMPDYFARSNERKLHIIGENILKNPNGYGSIEKFFRLKGEKLAYLESKEDVAFVKDNYFISNDRLLQYMHAMPTSKNFCCKEQLNLALHRLQAGGFFQKFLQERDFKIASEIFSSEVEEADHLRSLTVTDIGAAFTFLIFGYGISLFVLMVELIQDRKSVKN